MAKLSKNQTAEKTIKKFVFTQRQLKEKLGIKGNIVSMGMHDVQSPAEEEDDYNPDRNEWGILTVVTKGDGFEDRLETEDLG